MSAPHLSSLLEACRRRLSLPGLGILTNRALIGRIESYQRAASLAPRFSSVIVAYARTRVTFLDGVAIDPGDVETRASPSGVEVRAWLLVPVDTVEALSLGEPAAEIAFARLDRTIRNVLILRTRHGLGLNEIAARLGVSRRRVRRALRQGIQALGESLE
jgi:DNA-directed RNA polymerase specialized sigma24 family protein